MPLPDAVHEVAEYEAACAYSDGFAAGYAKALQDVSDEIVVATGVEPLDPRAVIRWLVRTFDRAVTA